MKRDIPCEKCGEKVGEVEEEVITERMMKGYRCGKCSVPVE